MEKDLKSMSRKELEKLLSDVKKAFQAAQARERRAARKAAQKAAAEYGFSLNELADEAPAPKKAKKPRKAPAGPKSKPQFANPENPSQTWTGKGRQPNWFRAQVENGADPETMRV
ncbi:H-NS histone family protein [Sulfitobacter sp. R18_1]|uniref:H-NS histone family protein n=1 Tax=Sulfitobacter sp. R18_1 TaxID=2821104 RepID=UPI001ADC9BA7|nr:H-NS histone family protein [Sulfitobacter sp. R18_1]MBO9429849.1 H-NS histone family protein [Sulfitobacter sp. R18_1]